MIIMTIAFILMKHTVIKELMHDLIFLAEKSEVVTKDDLQVARDAPHPTVPFLLFTVI